MYSRLLMSISPRFELSGTKFKTRLNAKQWKYGQASSSGFLVFGKGRSKKSCFRTSGCCGLRSIDVTLILKDEYVVPSSAPISNKENCGFLQLGHGLVCGLRASRDFKVSINHFPHAPLPIFSLFEIRISSFFLKISIHTFHLSAKLSGKCSVLQFF